MTEDEEYEPTEEDMRAVLGTMQQSKSAPPGLVEWLWQQFMEYRNNRPAMKKREEAIKQWHLQQGQNAADRENMGLDMVERGPSATRENPDTRWRGPEGHQQLPAKKFRDDPNEDEGY